MFHQQTVYKNEESVLRADEKKIASDVGNQFLSLPLYGLGIFRSAL